MGKPKSLEYLLERIPNYNPYRVMTPKEWSDVLAVSPSTIYGYLRRGLTHTSFPGATERLIRLEDMREFLEDSRNWWSPRLLTAYADNFYAEINIPEWLNPDFKTTLHQWKIILGLDNYQISKYLKEGLRSSQRKGKKYTDAFNIYTFLEEHYPRKIERMKAFFHPELSSYEPPKPKKIRRYTSEQLEKLRTAKDEFLRYLRANPNSTPEDWVRKSRQMFPKSFYLGRGVLNLLRKARVPKAEIRAYFILSSAEYIRRSLLRFVYNSTKYGVQTESREELEQIGFLGVAKDDSYKLPMFSLSYLYHNIIRALTYGNLESKLIRLPRRLHLKLLDFLKGISQLRDSMPIEPSLDNKLKYLQIELDRYFELQGLDALVNGLELKEPNFFDTMQAENPDFDENIYIEQLGALFRNKLFPKLTKNEELVLKLRYGFYDEEINPDGKEYELAEIGRKIGLSRERIRQIESKALRKARVKLIRLVPSDQRGIVFGEDLS